MRTLPLSPRQNEIIRLICRGKTDKEIADDLKISASTVGQHVGMILAKLGARSRPQAVFIWVTK